MTFENQGSSSSQEKGDIRPPGPDQKLKFRHLFEYAAVRTLAFCTAILPMFLVQWTGRLLGYLFYRLDKNHRKIALLNLDQAFGDSKTETEKRLLVKTSFQHFGCALLETMRLNKITRRNFLKHVTLDNLKPFYDGLQQGKGVILCSAHYGNWEVMNLVLGYLNLPMSAMARPLDNPLLHKYLERIRGLSGNGVIYKHKSVRKILSTLKENRIVGIVNDQDVHDRNKMMVDFFGLEAATTPVPAAMSYKTGAPIVTGYAIPLGKGRYHLRFGSLITVNQEGEKNEEIRRITRELNNRLEQQITFQPAYWLWMHKRFKTGADGPSGYYQQQRDV